MNHPGLSTEVNRAIAQSEIEGGVWVLDHHEQTTPEIKTQPVLFIGGRLEIQTQNTLYHLIKISKDRFLIQGHKEFCPDPTGCTIHGSTWGGSMLKLGFVGRGMHLEFQTEQGTITTSVIKDLTEVK